MAFPEAFGRRKIDRESVRPEAEVPAAPIPFSERGPTRPYRLLTPINPKVRSLNGKFSEPAPQEPGTTWNTWLDPGTS